MIHRKVYLKRGGKLRNKTAVKRSLLLPKSRFGRNIQKTQKLQFHNCALPIAKKKKAS